MSIITEAKVSLTLQEAEKLCEMINISVKLNGILMAADGLHLYRKIQEAFQPKKIQEKETPKPENTDKEEEQPK